MPAFLAGGGVMGAIMRAHDWSTTALGEPSTWPQSLRSAVSMCIAARSVGAIYWGPEFRLIYNDGYRPFLDGRHPWALGRTMAEISPTLWQALQEPAQAVLDTGEGFVAERQRLLMERGNGAEETFWYYSLAPIRGEAGTVEGIFLTALDTTEEVRAEQARNEGERRLATARDAAGLSADFRVLFEASPTPFLVVAPPDWTIAAVNDARLSLTGSTREEQIGRRLFDLFPDDPDDPDADGVRNLTASFERVVALQVPDIMAVQRYAVRDADGRFVERWWSPINTPVLGPRGEVALIIHRVEEVTELVRLRGEAAARDQLARDQQALIDRLRATQAAQRESEARFRNMADNAPVMMWITDPDGSCTYLNRRWYEFTGQAERAGEGYGWLDAVHPDDHAAAEEAFVSANAERRDYFVEFRVRRADGTYRWAIDAAAARFDDEGAFLGYVGSVIDIDERKEVEIALRRSEAKLRAVVDAVPVGVVLAEAPAGRIVGGNAQAERIFGHPVLTSPDIEGYREWVAQHPDGRPVQGHEYPLAKVIGGEADRPELEVLYRRGEGRDTWIRLIAAPIRDETGAVTGGVVAALDIDREKRTEAELPDLNETLEARVAARTLERDRVWKNSRDLLVVIDTQGIFQAVNPAWTSILGWETDELVGRCFLDFIHPDDQPSSRGALATASVEDLPLYDNRYRHKDGSHRWISWLAAPEGDLIYAYGRDVTAERTRDAELEVAQDALRQAQKMEAVGQLTGGVAHDFNNLLTVIKSSTDLLKRPNLPDERRARYIAAISDTADRAAKLTGQLLAFARRQALRPEVFDVGRSVRNLADMLGTITGSRIAISLGLPDETCCVNADPSQFDTALVNMAINARDAMGGEGCLTLTVWPVHRMPAIRSHKAVTGEFVAVSITDTGSGIAPQVLDRIFEPFFTTKGVGQGTGLGLSQVFGFAKQSGGEITVESELGRGSTFTLYLPRTVAGAGAVDDREPEVLIDGHGTCVLVVEDNVDVGTFARQTLSDLGYHTVLAANAGEALAELAKDAGRVDVVFSDVVMPGMSGIELGQEIRGRHPDLPVVLTSGYSHVLAQNGTSGFELLHKPYSVEDLSRVLRTAAGWRRRKRLLGQ